MIKQMYDVTQCISYLETTHQALQKEIQTTPFSSDRSYACKTLSLYILQTHCSLTYKSPLGPLLRRIMKIVICEVEKGLFPPAACAESDYQPDLIDAQSPAHEAFITSIIKRSMRIIEEATRQRATLRTGKRAAPSAEIDEEEMMDEAPPSKRQEGPSETKEEHSQQPESDSTDDDMDPGKDRAPQSIDTVTDAIKDLSLE